MVYTCPWKTFSSVVLWPFLYLIEMKNLYIVLLSLLVFKFAGAQETKQTHYSSWNSFIPKMKINKSFYVKSEIHFRRTNFLKDWEQLLIRPAIHYKPADVYDFALGYSYIRNYSFADFSSPINANEHNVWEEVELRHTLIRLKFNHRFRLEERFIDKLVQPSEGVLNIDGTTYNNRFRYRFTLTRPLIKLNETENISFQIFDELFINLDQSVRPKSFNQNWFYIGLSYPITSKMALGMGYHNIGLNGGNDTFITNHILQTTVSYSIN